MTDAPVAATQKGFLGFVERAGNKLPDPVFLFFYLILILIGISAACALLGVGPGAGGGGFMFFFVDPSKRTQVMAALAEKGATVSGCHMTTRGAQSWPAFTVHV